MGIEHALYMRDHDLCLEEYIQGLEDGSIQNPVTRSANDADSGNTNETIESDPGESSDEPSEETEELTEEPAA